MVQHKTVDELSRDESAAELERLAGLLAAANTAYHRDDAPDLSDADYDALKRRNAAIEARFPDLVRPDSPSAQVGAALAAVNAGFELAQRHPVAARAACIGLDLFPRGAQRSG